MTDRDGYYRFDVIKDGGYFVTSSKEDFVTWSYKHDVNPLLDTPVVEFTPHSHFQKIDVQLQHEAIIRGTIVYTTGSPAVGVSVAAVPKDYLIPEVIHFVPTARTKTDANGQFVLRGIAAGTYFVCVNGPGGYGYENSPHGNGYRDHETWYGGTNSYADASAITLQEGEERAGVRIEVTTERSYNVIVWPTGPEGQLEPARYIVHLLHRNHSVRSQGDGSYLIPAIPPGHYKLIGSAVDVTTTGMGEESFDVTSSDVTVHVHLGGPGEIRGTAKWEGDPIADPGKFLFLIVSEEGASQSARLDAQGNFHLQSVLPGHYRFKPILPLKFGPPAIPVNVECGGREISQSSPLVIGDRQNIPDCKVTLKKP